jgi:hypothetical protein
MRLALVRWGLTGCIVSAPTPRMCKHTSHSPFHQNQSGRYGGQSLQLPQAQRGHRSCAPLHSPQSQSHQCQRACLLQMRWPSLCWTRPLHAAGARTAAVVVSTATDMGAPALAGHGRIRTVRNHGVHPGCQQGGVCEVALELASLGNSSGHNRSRGCRELHTSRVVGGSDKLSTAAVCAAQAISAPH